MDYDSRINVVNMDCDSDMNVVDMDSDSDMNVVDRILTVTQMWLIWIVPVA